MSEKKRNWTINFQNGKSAHVNAKGKRMAIAKARVETGAVDSPIASFLKHGIRSYGSYRSSRY